MPARTRPYLALVLDERGITLEQLAEMVSASASHISKVARGTAVPSARLRRSIARSLDVDEDELFAPRPTLDSLRDDPDVLAWADEVVRRSTAAQALPQRVSDPTILSRIARILAPQVQQATTAKD